MKSVSWNSFFLMKKCVIFHEFTLVCIRLLFIQTDDSYTICGSNQQLFSNQCEMNVKSCELQTYLYAIAPEHCRDNSEKSGKMFKSQTYRIPSIYLRICVQNIHMIVLMMNHCQILIQIVLLNVMHWDVVQSIAIVMHQQIVVVRKVCPQKIFRNKNTVNENKIFIKNHSSYNGYFTLPTMPKQ